MGVFNSVFVDCPYCSEENEEQFKPGNMWSWKFPNKKIPYKYLLALDGFEWECSRCHEKFITETNIQIIIGELSIKKVNK